MDLLSYLARNLIVMDNTMTSSQTVTMTEAGSPWRGSPQGVLRRPSMPQGDAGIRRPYSEPERRYSLPHTDSSYFCLQSHPAGLPDLPQISWSEYTARRSLVKFRTRRAASYRSRDDSGGTPPSQLAVRMLCTQYEVCRSHNTPISHRIMAVFYCWFFGWITDVYSSLAHGGLEKSFLKWLLSCVLVSLGATVLLGIACLLAHGLLVALVYLLHSAITFVSFLTVVFILILTMATILSYSSSHDNQKHPSMIRRMRKAIKQKRF